MSQSPDREATITLQYFKGGMYKVNVDGYIPDGRFEESITAVYMALGESLQKILAADKIKREGASNARA